jgi:hypothetical protein
MDSTLPAGPHGRSPLIEKIHTDTRMTSGHWGEIGLYPEADVSSETSIISIPGNQLVHRFAANRKERTKGANGTQPSPVGLGTLFSATRSRR